MQSLSASLLDLETLVGGMLLVPTNLPFLKSFSQAQLKIQPEIPVLMIPQAIVTKLLTLHLL